MDRSEAHVKKYLGHLGFRDITHEPDGNVTPDFVLNGRIAVEVRRLNQNELTASGYRGLEETAIPLGAKIRKLITSLGPPSAGHSWFVSYTLRRPVPDWKELKPALRSYLEGFKTGRRNERRTTLAGALELELMPAGNPHSSFFVLGGSGDSDSGGWVFGETQKNLRLCIEEKTKKIAKVRHKYPEWWLILLDHIGYGVDDCDRNFYREQLGIVHDWDKVILLSPLDHRSAFEI